jgi:curved DNA-binding protein CbpA
VTTAGRFRDLAGQDAYKILGVPVAATAKEISRARRERQRTAHPDQGVAGDDASKLINTAASVLLDEALRREYDRWRRDTTQQLWDTADPGAATPRRPPAAPFRAFPLTVPGPAPEPIPEPIVVADDSDGGHRALLLIIGIFVAVLGLSLWGVSLLLP